MRNYFSRRFRQWVLVGMAPVLAACGFQNPEGSLKVGDVVPALRTKALADVGGDMARLTSYRYPDERMYRMSIDQALTAKKPILLEFATPGHCTVCDVQLQLLKDMLNKYGQEVIFMHMDQYMNPEAFIAFKVKGDPWTFIIDGEGRVVFKQPGRMLYNEIDAALARVAPSSANRLASAGSG